MQKENALELARLKAEMKSSRNPPLPALSIRKKKSDK